MHCTHVTTKIEKKTGFPKNVKISKYQHTTYTKYSVH